MKTLKTIGYAVGLPALLVLAWWALTASSTFCTFHTIASAFTVEPS